MSSRLLSFAALVAFVTVSGAASACPGAKMKSADGSQGSAATASERAGS
jgi:hypothetical protein